MASLSSWISTFTTCTTIFSSGNFDLLHSEPERALVNSEGPWDLLNSTIVRDCAILLLYSLEDLQNSTEFVLMTRKEITTVLLLPNEPSNYTETNWNDFQTHYDIHVLVKNQNADINELAYLSPFDDKGLVKNRTVVVSYLVFPPYILSAGISPTGLDVDTLNTISARLDITMKYKQAKTFNTLVNAVVEGQADMCISQPGLTIGRVNTGLDFNFMIYRNIMYAQRFPVPIDSFYTASQPFSNVVWTWILVTVIAVAMTFMVLNCWYGDHSMIQYVDVSISYIPIVSESVPQSWYRKRIKNPYFIVMFNWLLLGSLLSLAYETNLLANLVKVDLEEQPQTFQDLLDMNVGLYMFKGSVLTYLLQHSPKAVHRKVYQESFLKRGGYYPDVVMPQSVMDIILDGKAVTLVSDDAMAIYDHVFTMGTEAMISGPTSYYYSLKLPIRREINMAILKLIGSGVIQELTRRTNWALSMASRNKRREEEDNLTVIGMSHFMPMLICLVIGTIISILTFVYEKLVPFFQRRKINNSSSAFGNDGSALNVSYWENIYS